MVCLFPPEYDNSKLNRIIGSLCLSHIEIGTEASEKRCLDIASKIEENGGFWYAAHVTGDNGNLKIGKMQHIWKDKRMIAAQIPASREEVDPSYSNIINNTDLSYKREHILAYINAKDVENLTKAYLHSFNTALSETRNPSLAGQAAATVLMSICSVILPREQQTASPLEALMAAVMHNAVKAKKGVEGDDPEKKDEKADEDIQKGD